MKRILSVLLLCAVLLTGCNWEEPDYLPSDDILLGEDETAPAATVPSARALSMVYDPEGNLNPYACTDYTNRALFSLIYQGLFTVSRDYKVYPVLCKSYNVSADMTTWTFQIADALFSDGTAVTLEDVQASLKASMGSPWYGKRLQHVKTFSIMADSIVLQLDVPCENLPLLLDIPIVKASETEAKQPLGTGPYLLESNQLRRQAGWWCDANLPVSAATIALSIADSPAKVRDRFERSEVGLVCTDPGSLDYVDFRCDYELWDSENGLFVYLACNEDSEILQNEAIRTALTHAIDRDKLVKDYYRDFARSATLPASPWSPFYDKKLSENYGYDPQKLTDAVAAAELGSTSLTLMVSTADLCRRQAAQAIAKMLTECGFPTTVKLVAPAKLESQLRDGEYDLYLGQTRLSANMDLSAFFAKNGTLSFRGLANEDLYDLCMQSLANAGNYYSLHKAVMEDGSLCPILFQSYAIYGVRGSLPGLTPARDNLFFYHLGMTMEQAKNAN